MKIVFIETRMTGHHLTYLKTLANEFSDNDIYLIAPKCECEIDKYFKKVYYFDYIQGNLIAYIKMMRMVKKTLKEINPNLVHYVYADDLYRFSFLGVCHNSRKYKTIATCHQVRHSLLRDISLKIIAYMVDVIVVHTEQLRKDLYSLKIENIKKIEYPQFSKAYNYEKNVACDTLGIAFFNYPFLLAIGGTRTDKGLDLLLSALKLVNAPFHLIVAGKEEDFKRDYIETIISSYSEKVSLILDYLSDEQFAACMKLADIVVLPYRKSFDGASGPLGEGVWLKKMIIGPTHGSLGEIITNNHLGYTFETENVQDLADAINKALTCAWECDEKYLEYREKLSPERFQKQYYDLYMHCLGEKDEDR